MGRDALLGTPPQPPQDSPPVSKLLPTSRNAGGGDLGKLRQGVSPWLAVGAAGRRQASACVTL